MQMEDNASKHDAWYLKDYGHTLLSGLANSRVKCLLCWQAYRVMNMNMYCGKMIFDNPHNTDLNLSNMTSNAEKGRDHCQNQWHA